MKKINEMEIGKLNKYKMIFMGFASILLIIFSVLVIFNKSLVENLILYTTALALFVVGIMRLIVVFKSKGLKLKVLINLIETITLITIGVVIIIIAINPERTTLLTSIYCYLLSGALFGRGLVFLIEGLYCGDEKEVPKFIVHLAYIVCATIFVAREMTLEDLKIIILLISIAAACFTIFETFRSFKKYRKYKNENVIEVEETKEDEVEE